MAKPALSPRMTVAEFYDWHDGTDTRYELVHGVPMAMAPPTGRHAVIISNVQRSLDRRLGPPCRAYASGGVARDEADDECRIPDVFVSCEPVPPRCFTAPRLIVEVLSPSTEKEDRTDKLDFYKSLPSVELVLLVWQDKRRVQLHSREGVRWPAQDLIGTGTAELTTLDLSLSLDDIYAGLDLPVEPAA
jgi:Uma2 family endonuclease